MSRYESQEAYNKYFREYREKNRDRVRKIGREHMRKVRAEEKAERLLVIEQAKKKPLSVFKKNKI